MLTKGIGQVQPSFFPQIPAATNSPKKRRRKILLFSTIVIIVKRSNGVMAKKAFNQPQQFFNEHRFDSSFNRRAPIAIIVIWFCSRIDVKFPGYKNSEQNTFRNFSNGNETENQTECPWPAVCILINVGFKRLEWSSTWITETYRANRKSVAGYIARSCDRTQ